MKILGLEIQSRLPYSNPLSASPWSALLFNEISGNELCLDVVILVNRSVLINPLKQEALHYQEFRTLNPSHKHISSFVGLRWGQRCKKSVCSFRKSTPHKRMWILWGNETLSSPLKETASYKRKVSAIVGCRMKQLELDIWVTVWAASNVFSDVCRYDSLMFLRQMLDIIWLTAQPPETTKIIRWRSEHVLRLFLEYSYFIN